MRIDEAIIKQITGEYVITVRKLYENEFEFTPVAKIWMTTNHEPVIPGTACVNRSHRQPAATTLSRSRTPDR